MLNIFLTYLSFPDGHLKSQTDQQGWGSLAMRSSLCYSSVWSCCSDQTLQEFQVKLSKSSQMTPLTWIVWCISAPFFFPLVQAWLWSFYIPYTQAVSVAQAVGGLVLEAEHRRFKPQPGHTRWSVSWHPSTDTPPRKATWPATTSHPGVDNPPPPKHPSLSWSLYNHLIDCGLFLSSY